MYQDLLNLLRSQESLLHDLDAIQKEAFGDEHLLGVRVGIDRYWSRSALARFFAGSLPGHQPGAAFTWRLFHHFSDYPDITLGYRPPRWGQYCHSRGQSPDASPIYFKFILLKQPGKPQKAAFPVTDLYRHPVLYEYRPAAIVHSSALASAMRSQLAPGAAIWSSGAQRAGTAGGFLRHPASGQAYLVSCAHILGAIGSDVHFPPPSTRGRSNVVGQVVLNFPPTARHNAPQCSLQSLQNLSQMDVGLVELRPEVEFEAEFPGLGRIQMASSIGEMGPNDPVLITGSTSGMLNGELGELCIWQEITIDNRPCCFRNLFTITPPYPYARDAHMTQSGDSGAWVINTSAGMPAWDGMVIGSDGACAYACFAETILDACTERLNHALAVIV